MATSSSQDGAKKKRNPQRPLITPALPLNLKPKPVITSEPAFASPSPIASDIRGTHDAATTSEEVVTVTKVAQEADAKTNPSPSSELQADSNHVSRTPDASCNGPSEKQESAAPVEETLSKLRGPDNQEEYNSRSATPKASSRAELSNTQSPAPGSATEEPHTNGINSEAAQNNSLARIEHLNLELECGGHNPPIATGQPAKEQSTIMPRRYFSSEEPILDWADEMSEEMPPDTLHIPSVPHLPELPSESMASQVMKIKADSDHFRQVQPAMPIFGSAAAQELQSEFVIAGTPKRDTQHLTNGYSHTPEPKTTTSDYSMTPYQIAQTTPLQHGHGRGISQSFTARGPIPDMITHLTKLFETRDLADWTIQVVPPHGSYPPVAYPTHGAVISRSEVLRYFMGILPHARPMTSIITLSPPRYVLPPAFEAALKYLYNETILTPTECARYFTFSGDSTPITVKSYQLDFCFSYWLSGHILGLSAVVDAGLELLKEYLDWNTAELMIKESLEVKKASSAQHFLASPNGAMITSSTPGYPSPLLSSRKKRPISTGVDEHEILGVLIESMASGKLEVDLSDFRLDTSPSHILRSYLPDVQYHTKSHRALASITFGSLPTTAPSVTKTHARASQPVFSSSTSADDAQTFSPAEQALSAILLNLPSTELNELFGGLLQSFAENEVLDLFAKAIQERELRRVRVAESDWYQSEVSAKRRLHHVDCKEELVLDGKKSYLVSHLKEETPAGMTY